MSDSYPRGEAYAARFAALAASGVDVHGEATLCDALLAPGSRVLDAGCGTGRVAVRLAELGHRCVGVDLEERMLEVARAHFGIQWHQGDLSMLDLPALGEAEPFDLVVAAGNVIPLIPHQLIPDAIARLARHLCPGGLLVAGFGLDRAHLPSEAGLVDPDDYDRWCTAAGLEPGERWAAWDRAPYEGGGYAVHVHVRRTSGCPNRSAAR